jgi:hypothetical protein
MWELSRLMMVEGCTGCGREAGRWQKANCGEKEGEGPVESGHQRERVEKVGRSGGGKERQMAPDWER